MHGPERTGWGVDVDQATLVKSDQDIEGRVMLALSRARIPVTLVDWTYVPQLDEWQLVIATLWHETKGPREAYLRIIAALQSEGIYEDVPIRRVFVRSPEDPFVKALEQEIRLRTEGVVFIDDHSSSGAMKEYSLVFAPFAGRRGAVPTVRRHGKEELRAFLENRLHIPRSRIEEAFLELDRKGRTFIPHVELTARQVRNLGFA